MNEEELKPMDQIIAEHNQQKTKVASKEAENEKG